MLTHSLFTLVVLGLISTLARATVAVQRQMVVCDTVVVELMTCAQQLMQPKRDGALATRPLGGGDEGSSTAHSCQLLSPVCNARRLAKAEGILHSVVAIANTSRVRALTGVDVHAQLRSVRRQLRRIEKDRHTSSKTDRTRRASVLDVCNERRH